MSRDRNLGYERQEKDFYPTPAWVTEALLRQRCACPTGIWEPCCGDGAMARVLEAHGHHVVATDLVDRGYGEGGRDFLMETRLPDGVTAIVTNPPYGGALLRKFVDHALELTRPVGGMVALLVNIQWQTGDENSKGRIPAFDASVILTERILWIPDNDGRPAKRPREPLLDGMGLLAPARPRPAPVRRRRSGRRSGIRIGGPASLRLTIF